MSRFGQGFLNHKRDHHVAGLDARRPLILWSLWSILATALLIRIVHFWAIAGTPFVHFPDVHIESDLHTYWAWAQQILAGDWLGRDTYHPHFRWMDRLAPPETWYEWWGGKTIFHHAPFYPYWVAFWLGLLNGSIPGVLLVQLLAGAVHPLIVFALARRLFDDRVGLVATAFTAVYGPFVFFQGTLLRDWLPPLVEPLALLMVLKALDTRRGLHWLLAGALLGIAILVKPIVLLFIGMLIIWLGVELRASLTRAGRAAGLLISGVVIVLLPLFARNLMVDAPVLAVSNRAAEGIIEGNAPDARPFGMNVPNSLPIILEQADGKLMHVLAATLATYDGAWLPFVQLQFLKLRALIDPLEIPNNLSLDYGGTLSSILQGLLGYGAIFPLGVAGLILARRPTHAHRLMLLYTLAVGAGLLATIVLARYRLVLVPILIIYGAAACLSLWDAVRSRRARRAGVLLGTVALAMLIQQWVAPLPGPRIDPAIALHPQEYFLSTRVYLRDRRFEQALGELSRLKHRMDAHPEVVSELLVEKLLRFEAETHVLWAKHLVMHDREDDARRHTVTAEALYQQIPEIPGVRHAFYNLGQLFLALDDVEKGRFYLEHFLRTYPEDPLADKARRLLERNRPNALNGPGR